MAFLLVVPAVILAASFLEMRSIGDEASATVITSDNVYYAFKNTVNEIIESSYYGDINSTLDMIVSNYTNATGLNVSYTYLGSGRYNITVRDEANKIRYSKEIVTGRLLFVDVEPNSTYYQRNVMIPINTTVRDILNNYADGANVNLSVYYPNSTLANNTYLTTNANGFAGISFSDTITLGMYTISALANKTGYTNGQGTSYFYIRGVLNVSISTNESNYTTNDAVEITANVTATDIYELITGASVSGGIVFNDGVIYSFNMTDQGNGIYYNNAFTNTSMNGTYTIDITATKSNYFTGYRSRNFSVS